MLALDPAHRAGRGAHHHAVGGHQAARHALHPAQQGAVRHPGRREDAVALRQLLQIIDLVEIADPPFARAGAFILVAEQQAALELPADAAQRRAGQHTLGRAAGAHIDVDIGFGIGRRDHSGHVAVGDQHHAAADGAQFGDQLLMARAVEHADDDVLRGHAFRRRHRRDILLHRAVEVDHLFGIARSHRQLVHIDIGRVEQAAFL